MTFRFSKKESIALIFIVLLTILSIFAGYYFYLEPKYKEIDTKNDTLKSEQEVLTTLQQKQTEKSSVSAESIAELQQKVPVKPQLEQLILDLEKAEVLSGSIIKNMAFTEGDVASTENAASTENKEATKESAETEKTDSDANATEQESDQATDQNNSGSTEKNNENGTENTAKYVPTPLPEGVKKLTVALQVESSNYEELRSFIEALEDLPRTIVVETVSFSGVTEVTDLDTEAETLSYSLTLSAFFMPALTDLQDKLPELVTPPPANKTTPFNRFPDL
ncbi:hypothetical protein [Bacillus sp. T3]|uniref:hypothetical protein n=1 Tax=Bacillus sp. T3 TaxID=467262 RepID=UPI002982AD09|nr:hypothetical protein [Bacillus sp. T3]